VQQLQKSKLSSRQVWNECWGTATACSFPDDWKKKKHHCIVSSIYCQQVLNLWCQEMTLVDMQSDAEKTSHPKSSAMKSQSNWWPLKSRVFCRVHHALNSSTKGLKCRAAECSSRGLQKGLKMVEVQGSLWCPPYCTLHWGY
jgi:hypothetical protein